MAALDDLFVALSEGLLLVVAGDDAATARVNEAIGERADGCIEASWMQLISVLEEAVSG